jgi:lipopolysaccharide transport system permease protein
MRQEILIEPTGSARSYWADLWRYRELFYFLTWRDILVRYKQTAVGIAWAVLRPLVNMAIFTVVFGKFAGLSSGKPGYPLLVLCALLPWQFLSNALAESGSSLLNNSNLISKVYFPRMLVPASAVLTSFVEFCISAVLLLLLMGFYRTYPGWHIVFVPALILLVFAGASACGLWLSALTVRYRDLRIVVPFLVQAGYFISPVGYSLGVVPEKWRLFYSLNPAVGIIEGFRWSLLRGNEPFYWPALALSVAIIGIALVSGALFFRRAEEKFADVI